MKTLNKLSKDEEKSINLSGKYDTLFIHDIENTIGYKKPDHKEDSYFTELLEELDSECTATFNLQNAFEKNSETIFYDFGHVGDNGNKIIADNMFKKIIAFIR